MYNADTKKKYCENMYCLYVYIYTGKRKLQGNNNILPFEKCAEH